MAHFRTGAVEAGKIQDEPGISCVAPESKVVLQGEGTSQKDTGANEIEQ